MRDTTIPHEAPEPNRTDFLIALAVGVCALAAYVRTLAPDVLYGDSAEFQTLTYTLGTTHSTGYPVYLLLARLLGFLPVGSLAWRVNLLSALSAAVTLSVVFLLIRHLTHSRIGALLGSVALGLSYTFWSQAIILAHAEQLRPDITILEASPHGAEEGMVADTLIQELKDALREGRPVYAERVYANLRNHFRVQPALGGEWYRLSLPKTNDLVDPLTCCLIDLRLT